MTNWANSAAGIRRRAAELRARAAELQERVDFLKFEAQVLEEVADKDDAIEQRYRVAPSKT